MITIGNGLQLTTRRTTGNYNCRRRPAIETAGLPGSARWEPLPYRAWGSRSRPARGRDRSAAEKAYRNRKRPGEPRASGRSRRWRHARPSWLRCDRRPRTETEPTPPWPWRRRWSGTSCCGRKSTPCEYYRTVFTRNWNGLSAAFGPGTFCQSGAQLCRFPLQPQSDPLCLSLRE